MPNAEKGCSEIKTGHGTAKHISSVMTIELESSMEDKLTNTMLNALSLSVIIPLTMYSVKKKRVLQEGLSVVNVILLSLGGVTLAFSLTVSLLMFGNDISTKYSRIALICMCVIGLVFLICTRVIISGKMQNRLLKSENNYVRHIMKAQETYYEMLLQRDEETKKFRHDFQNHLNCLFMLYQEKKWDEFESYLKSLDGALREIRQVVETGNKIVNTILSDIISKHPGVKYIWKGCLPSEFNITPMQLCTIFSNLICNAFEAAEKVENGDVYIEVRNIGTSVRVLITNSSVSVPKIENGKYISSKKEDNHGFGIGNVIKVLDSLNGAFRIEPVDDRINVEIIIPGAFDLN